MRAHAPTARRGVPTSHTRTRSHDGCRGLRLQARARCGCQKYLQATSLSLDLVQRPRGDGASRDRLWCGETSSRWGCDACGLNSSAGSPWLFGSRTALQASGGGHVGVLPEGARVSFARLEAVLFGVVLAPHRAPSALDKRLVLHPRRTVELARANKARPVSQRYACATAAREDAPPRRSGRHTHRGSTSDFFGTAPRLVNKHIQQPLHITP